MLVDNYNYNPKVRIGRFSGRPLFEPHNADQDLRQSIQYEGQRNPICVWDLNSKYYCAYGASRVRAVRALALSGHSDGFLKAVISGPSPMPPPTVEYEKKLDLRSVSIEGLLGDDFRELPKTIRVEPEGWLYFDGCVERGD